MRFERKKLVVLRKDMGLTQSQVADRAGLTINQIKKHEIEDINIGLHTLGAYAKFFKIDLSELFEFTGQEKIFAEINALKKRNVELEAENQRLSLEASKAEAALGSFKHAYEILVNKRGGR